MKRFTLLLLIIYIALASCSKKPSSSETEQSEHRQKMEAEAIVRLSQARILLTKGNYADAAAVIKKMRTDCYLALDGRRNGILLLDTIELEAARSELARTDSLIRLGVDTVGREEFDEACRKVQFYERKIRHDKNYRE